MGIGIEAKEDVRSVEQRLSEKLRVREHLLEEIKEANRLISAPLTVEDDANLRPGEATYLHLRTIERDTFISGKDLVNSELRLHLAQHFSVIMRAVALRVEAHLPRLNEEIQKLMDELQEKLNAEPVTEPGNITTKQAEDIVARHRETE